MDVQFNLEQASIVGWLSRREFPSPREMVWPEWPSRLMRLSYYAYSKERQGRHGLWQPPRVPVEILQTFLEGLPESVVTSNGENHQILRDLVGVSMSALGRALETKQVTSSERRLGVVLSSTDVGNILAPLRDWFDVPFYFMPIGQQVSLERFRDSTDYTLWFQCSDDRREVITRDLLDPFPPLKQLLISAVDTPVTACWTWSGEAVLVPQYKVPIEQLLYIVRETPIQHLWSRLQSLDQPESPTYNILQLSDLHFGAKQVTNNKLAYVEQYVHGRIKQVQKIGGVVQPVITGDVMDTPNARNLRKFEAFSERLAEYAATNVICIPGNHDTRKKGFLWKQWWGTPATLWWKSVVRSDECKAIFVCFDSCRDATLAQGWISDDQFLQVATQLAHLRTDKNDSDYVRIALVHHHPFSTRDDEIDTLPVVGVREERFLRMKNGDLLVRWCAGNSVPLILHGHKHHPRFIGQEIEIDGRTRLVRAVGCGASLGVEKKPLSYNWITWQPDTRQWSVSYFADPGDGSGFREKRLAIGAQP